MGWFCKCKNRADKVNMIVSRGRNSVLLDITVDALPREATHCGKRCLLEDIDKELDRLFNIKRLPEEKE